MTIKWEPASKEELADREKAATPAPKKPAKKDTEK